MHFIFTDSTKVCALLNSDSAKCCVLLADTLSAAVGGTSGVLLELCLRAMATSHKNNMKVFGLFISCLTHYYHFNMFLVHHGM